MTVAGGLGFRDWSYEKTPQWLSGCKKTECRIQRAPVSKRHRLHAKALCKRERPGNLRYAQKPFGPNEKQVFQRTHIYAGCAKNLRLHARQAEKQCRKPSAKLCPKRRPRAAGLILQPRRPQNGSAGLTRRQARPQTSGRSCKPCCMRAHAGFRNFQTSIF